MLVLGSSGDDKGTQLEVLTRDLLSGMGYSNIVRNFISSGGEEIDVSADIAVPNIGGTQARRLVCECKAHQNPIALPDWMKFLGKVLFEEARTGGEISACFVALGGVNGNVAGNYDELKNRRPNIRLVTGETILNELSRLYGLCSAEAVNETLRQYTDRQYRTLDVAYYDRKVYYVVIFEGGAFTILNAQGQIDEGEQLERIKPLVQGATPAHTYIKLEEEAAARRRRILARKSVLAQLIIRGGSLSKSSLEDDSTLNLTVAEFESAVKELTAQDWIIQADDSERLSFHPENDQKFYGYLAKIYGFLLGVEPSFNLPAVLRSPFYISHINENLVAEIQRIQGGLPLTPEDINDVIKMLRWSPSAVLQAVQPDEMIVLNRKGEVNEQFNRFQRNYFFRELYRSLRHDLTHSLGRAHLLDTCRIREVETTQKVTIKSGAGVQLQSDLHERIGIGLAADGLVGPDGSPYLLVLMMEDAGQPWEVAVWRQEDEEAGGRLKKKMSSGRSAKAKSAKTKASKKKARKISAVKKGSKKSSRR